MSDAPSASAPPNAVSMTWDTFSALFDACISKTFVCTSRWEVISFERASIASGFTSRTPFFSGALLCASAYRSHAWLRLWRETRKLVVSYPLFFSEAICSTVCGFCGFRTPMESDLFLREKMAISAARAIASGMSLSASTSMVTPWRFAYCIPYFSAIVLMSASSSLWWRSLTRVFMMVSSNCGIVYMVSRCFMF